jgi:3,4-dihydroxy 2-butanone 4-phosphate synthase/GTP cyclohydrolase II
MSESQLEIAPFSEIVSEFHQGKMVIMVDDADRENEGDLILATEKVTSDAIAFMMREARGLICVTVSGSVAERINIPLQTLTNNSSFQTPFAVSVDAREVAGFGVTASGRARTMQRMIAQDAVPNDFMSPGHVFPLIASPAGVIGRQGQTEGSFDLARLSGLTPSGIICEILNPDGSMARGAQLNAFARRFGLKITSVAEVLKHRIAHEVLVREIARTELTTPQGRFTAVVLADDVSRKEHLALVYGDIAKAAKEGAPLVRIHSECLTGDVLGSRRCDCGPQLHRALDALVKEGAGIVLYLRQEGRGIGLANKLRAYALQDQGHDTVDANIALGFAPDLRDFAVAAKMLSTFGVNSVRLMTNNPEKVKALEVFGVRIAERVSIVVEPDEYSRSYLETKRTKLGHLI